MGIAAAMGAINVAKISSQPATFKTGTRDLDFQDFGPSSLTVLHGREAVIPQGSSHILAREIAGAMGGGGMNLGPLLEELRAMRSDAQADRASMAKTIQRAVRDGVLLAT